MSGQGFWNPDGDANQIITITIFCWSALQVWKGTLLGARSHAKPRLFVAVALTGGILVNIAGLLGWVDPQVRASVARAVTWVLVLSLGFTAMTGVAYGRKVEEVAKKLDSHLSGEIDEDD